METSELGLLLRVDLQLDSSYGRRIQGRKQIFHGVKSWQRALVTELLWYAGNRDLHSRCPLICSFGASFTSMHGEKLLFENSYYI